ncbi:hypothetical protein BDQ17DRAFT_1363775 [Cyathus striatus]|nr:hypothetical protein BDQ17DRAFT_1363775 [Cyathus striatus]
MVSNTTYPFGPSGVPCAPLTVDRVTNVFMSPFPLFQLPMELYSNVTRYLDSTDLKSQHNYL